MPDREEVLRLAREAGAHEMLRIAGEQDSRLGLTGNAAIERFAALVAERCAKVCEQMHSDWNSSRTYNTEDWPGGDDCASAIRSKFGGGNGS